MIARVANTFNPQAAAAKVFASKERVVKQQVLSAKDLESMGINFDLSDEQPIPPNNKDSLENHFANPHHKVEFCHRTNSANNPYNLNTADYHSVNGDSVDDNGQGDHALEHTGPVVSSIEEAQQLKAGGRKWGDIIPPDPALGVPGLNWTPEGQAVFGDGCGVEGTEPTNTLRPPTYTPKATGTHVVVETPTPTGTGTQPSGEKTPTKVWSTPTLEEGGDYESYKSGASDTKNLGKIILDTTIGLAAARASFEAIRRRKEIKNRLVQIRFQNRSNSKDRRFPR